VNSDFAKASILALVASACVCQSGVAQEDHEYQLTPISGNRIAWSCEGDGAPTIVLIAGSGLSAHDSFGRIFHSYDGPGRICMYDRAGMGKSVFAQPITRTTDQLTAELHQLAAIEDWGQLIVVAHSFGGFIARAYADEYRREVVGMLLLDVAHEDWLPHLQAKMSDSDWSIMEQVVEWNERSYYEDYFEAQEAARSTRLQEDLPITILSRGIPHTRIRLARMSYAGIDLYEAEHSTLQAKLEALSSRTEHRIARYSSHDFNESDPWLVIEEIKLLIGRL
jgi:pimeloyl-ACP methyl ester carboxylesterase